MAIGSSVAPAYSKKKSLEDAASPRRSLPMQLKYSSLLLSLRRFSSLSSILFDLI